VVFDAGPDFGARAGIVINWCRDGGLDAEWTADARAAVDRLRPIDQYFLFWRFVVRNRLQREMRNDPADFLAFLALLSFVNKSCGGPAPFVFKFIVGECRGEQALSR
jgi:hypothetical protein